MLKHGNSDKEKQLYLAICPARLSVWNHNSSFSKMFRWLDDERGLEHVSESLILSRFFLHHHFILIC